MNLRITLTLIFSTLRPIGEQLRKKWELPATDGIDGSRSGRTAQVREYDAGFCDPTIMSLEPGALPDGIQLAIPRTRSHRYYG